MMTYKELYETLNKRAAAYTLKGYISQREQIAGQFGREIAYLPYGDKITVSKSTGCGIMGELSINGIVFAQLIDPEQTIKPAPLKVKFIDLDQLGELEVILAVVTLGKCQIFAKIIDLEKQKDLYMQKWDKKFNELKAQIKEIDALNGGAA